VYQRLDQAEEQLMLQSRPQEAHNMPVAIPAPTMTVVLTQMEEVLMAEGPKMALGQETGLPLAMLLAQVPHYLP
jgi:hypothetical protein